jgi:hypothetical protein
MKSSWRWRGVALVLVLAVGLGCNPMTSLYFMMVGVENKVPPEFKLASPDKEVTVLILAYTAPGVQTEQVGVGRLLGTEIAKRLHERCQLNRERVKIVPVHKVEKFKSDNPGWKTMGPQEIGQHFEADYVVDLEVVTLSLYEAGSHRTLYKGRCKIDINVFDMTKPQDGKVFSKSFSTEYPRSRGPIPVADDNNTEKFRDLFVSRIANDISWLFTAHVSNEEYQCD